jgi:molybdopterin converting factor small subunit
MPRITVSYISSLRPAFGGADQLELEAGTLRDLKRKLVAKYPRMQKRFDEGIVMAIDGRIYRDNLDVSIPDGAEVYLMPRIQGG